MRPLFRPLATLALALLPATAGAQTFRSADSVIRRIWQVGMEQSQTERLAQVLIDSIGPRLSGTTGYQSAVDWLDRTLSSSETVLLPWLCLIAFVRLSTHPAVYQKPQPVADALENVEAWLDLPNVVTDHADANHSRRLSELLHASGGRGDLTNDAHLAALAIQYDATVVSYDSDFGRFSAVRWERPR